MKILILCMAALLALPLIGCKTAPLSGSDAVQYARQKLEELPEPTFQTIEVYVHDLSALGTTRLIAKQPDAKVPLTILADSALSILTTEQVSMVDVIALSDSLDQIKSGNVKLYLDIAWSLLEMNGVIRRDDLTAVLTSREQRLLIALFKGIKLGTAGADAVGKVLNSTGPRY